MRRLMNLAVAENLCSEDSVRVMEENLANGKFTAEYYIAMWSQRAHTLTVTF